jgi:hypothetical protein
MSVVPDAHPQRRDFQSLVSIGAPRLPARIAQGYFE